MLKGLFRLHRQELPPTPEVRTDTHVVPIWDRQPGWAMDNPEAYIDRRMPSIEPAFKPIQILPAIALINLKF